jgi:osmotically-inducible protein OsmY
MLGLAVPNALSAEGQEKGARTISEDEVLKKRIVEQLVQDARVDAADIQVAVIDSEVTLEGTVPTYFARQEAYQIAWSIKGVSNVQNRLTVKYIPPVPDDGEIKKDAREVLHINPHIDEDQITL